MISRLLAKPATTVQDAVEKQVFADCPDRGTTAAVGGFLPVRFRGAEVDNRTFAIGHKDRHFLDPQQQAMAADISRLAQQDVGRGRHHSASVGQACSRESPRQLNLEHAVALVIFR